MKKWYNLNFISIGIWLVIIVIALLSLWSGLVRADMISDLVPMIIQAESSGNPNALGKSNERGLMQISEIVFREFLLNNGHFERMYDQRTEKDGSITNLVMDSNILMLYSPKANVVVGTWYLRKLEKSLKKHNLLDKAHLIMAYNSGLSRALNNPIPKTHKNLIYRKIYKEYWNEKKNRNYTR